MPWRSFHWKKLFLPRVFKGFGWACIKNHWFFKVFELCIILGKNLANTKGFGSFLWKILKTPRFWKVFGMTHRCLDAASIEKKYFYLSRFLSCLFFIWINGDVNISKQKFLSNSESSPWTFTHSWQIYYNYWASLDSN